MKVVLLAPTPPPHGGIAGWTKRMMQTKLKNDWEVVVVDEKVTGNRDAYNGSKKNYIYEAKRCLRIWGDLKKALKDPEAVVVQACIPAGTTSMMREIVSAYITKKKKRKFIVHFRCTLPNMVKSAIALRIFKKLTDLCDCVFVLNTASVEFLKKVNPNKQYEQIPNFIETEAIKERTVYNEELKNLTYVGGVIEEKGCDLIASVAKHFPDKSFRLVGNVDMDTSVFPENVVLTGEKSKEFVQKELDTTDAFLFLTRYIGEGFSNALSEAMSHSLPCIVSDWAANADMIENKGGVVLKKYEVKNVVEAIREIENPEIRRKMGKWNCNKIKRAYCDSVVTGMYVDAYEKLIK